MNVIFTCGGTGGHINPAIAVANVLRERCPDANILFVGARGGMEEKLVPQAGYELVCLPGSGLSRKLNFDGIKKNVKAVQNVFSAVSQCRKIIKDFKPDVIILGCTHYPIIKDTVKKCANEIIGDVEIVDSGSAAASAMKEYLASAYLENTCGGNAKYFVSESKTL